MKKIEFLLINLLILITGCSSKNQKQIIEQHVNNEGQKVVEYRLNDSIIERELSKDNKIEARELENTKSDTIEILYYDEYEKLVQSLKFNTKNSQSLIYNYIYYSDGGIAEKHIKNQDN